jgi:hypothetical protein
MGRGWLRVGGGQSLLFLGSYLHTPILFTLYISPAIHFNGSDGTAYNRASIVQNKYDDIIFKILESTEVFRPREVYSRAVNDIYVHTK